jgi:predicted enzyme involved in methoxymalonyl-ACP biosynthesis
VFHRRHPFERNLVRQDLPMVAVPEVSDDPTGHPVALADAGYFEALSVTDEDRERTSLYQGNKARPANPSILMLRNASPKLLHSGLTAGAATATQPH